MPLSEVPEYDRAERISGQELRNRLTHEEPIPEWFSFPEILTELKKLYPPKHQQGCTLLITGLPGAGKTTLAEALMSKLLEVGQRSVTVLDGDRMRQLLSSDLGFSKADRLQHLRRLGFVAREITKHRGIAICAVIAPYQSIRDDLRRMIGSEGGFVEVFLDTPVNVCESRDKKGFYHQARLGNLKNFTGINGPYEKPESPNLVIDMSKVTPLEAVQQVILKTRKYGLLHLDSFV